jgi:hypothetical protein
MNDRSSSEGSTSADKLIAGAKVRAEASPVPEEWGYRITLDEGEHFAGRWRGEAVDELNETRRIFLFWDQDDERCFSRTYAVLARSKSRSSSRNDDLADLNMPRTSPAETGRLRLGDFKRPEEKTI